MSWISGRFKSDTQILVRIDIFQCHGIQIEVMLLRC